MSVHAVKSLATDRRIRGPNLKVFIKAENGVPFHEAVRRADAEGRVIASNARLDRALFGDIEWKSIDDAFCDYCWSGTIAAYVEPGKPFGKMIEYFDPETGQRWALPVPEKYQDRVNCILIAEHPYFTLENDRHGYIVHAVRPHLLEEFPAPLGLYEGGPLRGYYRVGYDSGIPLGQICNAGDPNVRLLARFSKRVGPVVRSNCNNDVVYIDDNPSSLYGVAVEAPALCAEAGASLEFTYARYAQDIAREFSGLVADFHGAFKLPPDLVRRAMEYQIDSVVSGFKWFGKDCAPLRKLFNSMGAFVTQELPEKGYSKELVLELKRYCVQKLKEVSK